MSGPKPLVLITDPLHPDAQTRLEAWAEVERLPSIQSQEESDASVRAAARRVQGIIVRRLLPADLFERPFALRGIVRQGVGLDFIPVDRATAHGVPVANTPGVNANAVAEYVFAAMLAHCRQLATFDAELRAGQWQVRAQAGARTFELRGRTLGVIGFGAIGRRIAEIAQAGFQMKVVTCTTTPSTVPNPVATLTMEDLFEVSDFVVVACPLTPMTKGMVNATTFAHAKPGVVLINVGRGPVVQQADLVQALETGKLAGAVLDVFEIQPLPQGSPLRRHPAVLLTPHLAGITQESERAMGVMAVDTLRALLQGDQPANVVNRQVFTRPPA